MKTSGSTGRRTTVGKIQSSSGRTSSSSRNRTSPTRKSSRTTSSRTRSSSKKRSKKKPSLLAILVAAGIVITGYALDIIPSDDSSTDVDNGTAVTEQVDNGTGSDQSSDAGQSTEGGTSSDSASVYNLSDIPEYSENPYVVLNGGKPYFSTDNLSTKSYEEYSELDSLGRCGVCEACIGQDLMPDDERGSIGQVKPTGWHTVKYDCVDGKYLYNRCHLIGWQLTGENANKCNLITGTRYMNVDGMLPFENMVADYIKETGNHVQYRVTPIFEGDNLLASGVVMEAYSIEDNGTDICFNVYVYNVQPEIAIDYETGESYYVG